MLIEALFADAMKNAEKEAQKLPPAQRVADVDQAYERLHAPNVIPIGRANIPATILYTIFEVVRAEQQHSVKIGNIEAIQTRLGSRIVALETLTPEQRQLAEGVVYNQIRQTLY
ncbi:hypothetical protein [Mycobacterium camsae]|uniref:hypothetical protein n=1 Tax=Mycobacterium gordonae TaxID=1778 RepID=UPI00197FD513|nr:hypothetical protein [Mycobacterium gordonae]